MKLPPLLRFQAIERKTLTPADKAVLAQTCYGLLRKVLPADVPPEKTFENTQVLLANLLLEAEAGGAGRAAPPSDVCPVVDVEGCPDAVFQTAYRGQAEGLCYVAPDVKPCASLAAMNWEALVRNTSLVHCMRVVAPQVLHAAPVGVCSVL